PREPGQPRRPGRAARRAKRLSAARSDEPAAGAGCAIAGTGRGALQPRPQLDRGAHAGPVEQDTRGDRTGERALRLPGADGRAAVSDWRLEVVRTFRSAVVQAASR